MEKLELKHFIHYIEHGMKAVTNLPKDERNSNRPIRITEIILQRNCVRGVLTDNAHHKEMKLRYEFIKPILHPFSVLKPDVLRKFNFNSSPAIGDDKGFYSYEFMTYCFENQIDVFGLIDKGLAIDVNTLK